LFFAHKKYSRRLINLRLGYCSHSDYFNDVFRAFGTASFDLSWAYGGWSSSQIQSKYPNLCSEDERKSYGVGTTWGWV